MDIRQELNRVFRDVFSRDEIHILDHTTAADIPGWDSLAHISLVLAVEEHFQIRFAMAEITGMKDVGEMIRLIEIKRKVE